MNAGKGGAQIGIILMMVGVVIFILLVISGLNILNISSPEVSNNCIKNGELNLLQDTGQEIATQEAAEDALKSAVPGSFEFRQNTLEVCDVKYSGYVFESLQKARFAVCGDGKIYQYADLCKKAGLWDSLKSALFSKKNATVAPIK